MRVLVLGSGVVGVTTAFALAEAGNDVTVVDRESGPALGTSYGNASQISPALSSPWSSPGIAHKALGWMVQRFPPLVFGRMPDAAMLRFLAGMLRSATPQKYASSKKAMVALGEYSRDLMIDLRSKHPFDYAGRSAGTTILFRNEKQREGYRAELEILEKMSVPGRLVNLDELRAMEPNVAISKAGIVGAAHLPGDETGDCFLFTNRLAELCNTRGVRFLNGVSVTGLVRSGSKISAVKTTQGEIQADLIVSCLGAWSAGVLEELGLRIPVYPLKGYSLTIKADSDAIGPRSTVGDETYKIGITNLGDRIRVGGTAELAGYDLSRKDKRYAGLSYVVQNLFPNVSPQAVASAERWCGLRPMTPDGPPLIGRIACDNLFINAGHGTLGWTMACGAAQLTADLIAGRPTAVDAAPFSPTRYQ
ncbi:D-amino acid dehydrogenase [Brucella intermedia]|uniref:D-amino acid dehydrogenase n=1 Tax=Brucella intermedia TaxID=94625 RepID=UPI00224ADFC0|nr:D-amino acid dehydrogenase [Brucella intermedia]